MLPSGVGGVGGESDLVQSASETMVLSAAVEGRIWGREAQASLPVVAMRKGNPKAHS